MIMLETAPLIESDGLVPDAAHAETALLATSDGALEAALRQLGASEATAAAEAPGELLFDLFVDARSGYRAEGAGRSAQDILATTSWRGWLIGGDSASPSSEQDGRGLKELWAAFEDVDGDGKEDEPIVVKGGREVDDDSGDDAGGDYGDGSYPGGTSGGGGWGGGEEVVAKETPCVEAAPSNVPLQQLNNDALKLSNEIATRNDEMWEYGAIFYLKDGVLQNTGVFGGGQPGDINWNLGFVLIANGAVIVAILHNHPDEPGVDDTIPSLDTMRNPGGHDWRVFDNFLSVSDRNSQGISTDPNLLMYIYTNEDSKTRVYDKTDRNTTQKSCSLQ
jgi:hypothetical protein